MDPSQFDALTRQLAQLATSLSTVQSDITATREERKNLAAKLSNFKRIPRLIDTNSEASHNRQYHRGQSDQKYFQRDRRNRDQIRKRERDNFEILTQWNALKQGNQLVTEYIMQFEKFRTKCHLIEDENMTLSKFSQGLRDDLKRELFLRGVTTLDHAYSLARDYKLIISTPYEKRGHRRSPISLASPHHKSIIKPSLSNVPPIWKNNCKGRDSPRSSSSCRKCNGNHLSVSLAPLPPVKSLLGPPPSNVPPILENKGIICETSKTSHLLYISCKDFGHISSKCPNRALVIEERKNAIEESLEDLAYGPKLEDFDDYSEDTSLSGIPTLPETLETIPLVSDNSRSHVICHTLTKLKEFDDFTSHPWRIQSLVLSTKSKFSTTDQPQTDGQNEIANRSLGNLLQSLVKKNLENWDSIPPTVHIAYNNSMNRSLGLNPFEVVYSYKSRRPLDLILMSPHASVLLSAEAFVYHLHNLHIEINKQHDASHALYKLQADSHKQYFEFNIGDYVIL
ncbi:uncharacterized protein LOC111410306 [Olea europaea var. sylvestris]|uniref:uncharacterized protein LOC111410306 n=1 Tax=Olea europaea var. sylvestris TaxID=158386 RepID=UPI000C1D8305|nr:uncharacterized protein LOC111410306 [Olea europaea var. sylvestris]XP_022896341.1 uncharacterized protein LOC111410306 [Olea europaea var. sylvestris]